MTSHKKVPVLSFGHVSCTHGRDASAQKIALSNSELLTLAEIQDGDRRHLGFSVYVNFSKYTDRINLKQEVKVN